jgi:hypothetical protein
MAINYSFSVTGDCQNTSSGAFNLKISPFGNALPVTINWLQPSIFPSQVITTNDYLVNSLSAGTYVFSLVDSNPVPYSASPLTFYISSSATMSLSVVDNTSCGSNNGSILASFGAVYSANTLNLYRNSSYLSAFTITSPTYTITGLSQGVYYADVTDGGGCSGVSNSVAINPSVNFDFGFYNVNTPACYYRTGKIIVTGITGGVPPYTYSWSADTVQWTTAPTGDTATGLSSSNFSCTITDSNGCSKTKTTQLTDASNLSLITLYRTSPSCFQSNGEITYIISGGSPPYNYQLSNGVNQILFSDTVTFSDLSSGNYTLLVTDAGLCTYTNTTFLSAPNTFTTLSTTSSNSHCSFNDGSINVIVQGGTPPYNFTIYNSNSGYSQTNSSFLGQYTFTSLSSDTYTLYVTDQNTSCQYSKQFEILNVTNFDFALTGQNTTCGYQNGIINVAITSATTGVTNFQYFLSNGFQSSITTATTYSFSGLQYGYYSVSVKDVVNNCTQTKNANVNSSSPPNLFLSSTGCLQGSGGTISALIMGNTGDYNLTWSPNVNSQEGIYLTGITGGTYTLTLSADSGCIITSSVDVTCNPSKTYTYDYILGESLQSTLIEGELDFSTMVFSGYSNIASSSEGCLLNYYSINVIISLGGIEYEFPFYFSSSLNDIPTYSAYCEFLNSSVLTIPYIESCEVNTTTNTITITTQTINGIEYYKDSDFYVDITIDYNVNCESIQECSCTGLVLKLDASNQNSYPGYGNTWYDLSSSSNNAIISGSSFQYIPEYGGGIRINNDISNDGSVEIPSGLNLNDLASTLNYSIIFAVKKEYYSDTASGISSILLGSTNGYNIGWRIIESSTGTTGNVFDGTYNISYGTPGISAITKTFESDVCIGMISRDGGNVTLSFNGDISNQTLPNSYFSGGYSNRLSNNGFGVGAFNGVFYLFYVYNRPLSTTEMNNIYNKLSTRFGL